MDNSGSNSNNRVIKVNFNQYKLHVFRKIYSQTIEILKIKWRMTNKIID